MPVGLQQVPAIMYSMWPQDDVAQRNPQCSVSGGLATEYSIIMSLDVPFMSAFFNYRAQQTSYIVILFTTKILPLPRFLKCTFPLPALTETCFEVNTLGEFAPYRSECSVGEGIEGGGCTCCPCNVILAGPH